MKPLLLPVGALVIVAVLAWAILVRPEDARDDDRAEVVIGDPTLAEVIIAIERYRGGILVLNEPPPSPETRLVAAGSFDLHLLRRPETAGWERTIGPGRQLSVAIPPGWTAQARSVRGADLIVVFGPDDRFPSRPGKSRPVRIDLATHETALSSLPSVRRLTLVREGELSVGSMFWEERPRIVRYQQYTDSRHPGQGFLILRTTTERAGVQLYSQAIVALEATAGEVAAALAVLEYALVLE